jgi:hypothetical protein
MFDALFAAVSSALGYQGIVCVNIIRSIHSAYDLGLISYDERCFLTVVLVSRID